MSAPRLICPECGYEIVTFAEAVEALEGGGRCLLCGSNMDKETLATAVDSWQDEAVESEGEQRAETEGEYLAEEESLFEGTPDFGEEGEDEEPLI
jgi:transcription initiation factor IIE alpha subunit